MASTRLFAGFVEVLSVVSEQRPIMVVLEDMHWADPASVDLVAFTARNLRRDRILLGLTNRPAGAAPRSPVRTWPRSPGYPGSAARARSGSFWSSATGSARRPTP